MADEIPNLPLKRTSIDANGIVMSQLKSRLKSLNPVSIIDIDGLKLNFSDGWLLVRSSGTEPKIRLTVEAKEEARVRQLCEEGLRLIKEEIV